MALRPQYLVPSILALILAAYPLPWHLQTRNIATLSMIFWMTLLNIVHTINCAIWADNTTNPVGVWGDISAAVMVGYNYGLPLSHLVLAKQLESLTSLRTTSPLYDDNSYRRHRMFDLMVTCFGPIFAILIHLSNMDRRFYVVEKVGPMSATYWDTWGVIITAIVPICVAIAVAVYTIMTLVNIHSRRKLLLSMISSDANINQNQFYRLLFLTLAELGTCGIRAIFNMMSFRNGPQPLGHRGLPRHNFTTIEQVTWAQISPAGHSVLNLQFFTVVACSIVFFLCFATSEHPKFGAALGFTQFPFIGIETKLFYRGILCRILPCLPPAEPEMSGRRKLGSVDSGISATSSFVMSSGSYPVTTSDQINLSTPSEGAEMSFEEMLGASSTPNTPSQPEKGTIASSKGSWTRDTSSLVHMSLPSEQYADDKANEAYLSRCVGDAERG